MLIFCVFAPIICAVEMDPFDRYLQHSVRIVFRNGEVTSMEEKATIISLKNVVKSFEDGKVVAGAGAPEIEVELALIDYASSVGGREQLAIEKFAKAMEIIPWTLAENAGIDHIDSIFIDTLEYLFADLLKSYFGITRCSTLHIS